jgi:uncharacterized protein YjbI with pentapeptide repeats
MSMKKHSPDEIKEILDKHRKWLRGETGGSRADLEGADLEGADLRNADLRKNLRGADLEGTTLPERVLEIGTNERGEIVINHPDLQPDENGVGHIVFSVEQAEGFVSVMQKNIAEAKAVSR